MRIVLTRLCFSLVTGSAAPVTLPWSPCSALGGSPARPAHAQLLQSPVGPAILYPSQSPCDLNAVKVLPGPLAHLRLLSDSLSRDVALPVLILPAGLVPQLPRSVLVLVRPPNRLSQAHLLAALKLQPRLAPGHQLSATKVLLQHIVSGILTCSSGPARAPCTGPPVLRSSCHQQQAGAPARPRQVVLGSRLLALQLLPAQVVLPPTCPEARSTSRLPVPVVHLQPNQVVRRLPASRPHHALQARPLPAPPAVPPYLPQPPAAPSACPAHQVSRPRPQGQHTDKSCLSSTVLASHSPAPQPFARSLSLITTVNLRRYLVAFR